MIIYNVTVNIDNSVHEEWLEWMKSKHIPDVVGTGCFTEGNIFRILVNEESGISYSVQYSAASMDDVNRYLKEHAEALRNDALRLYKDKFVAFRTLLERID
jgi:pyrroloquinoline quinone (PQQ) biosynthesis protein C